jgi:hypothetical protein
MFMAELGIMRKLSHPYIIRYIGCGVLKDNHAEGPPKHYIAVVRLLWLPACMVCMHARCGDEPPQPQLGRLSAEWQMLLHSQRRHASVPCMASMHGQHAGAGVLRGRVSGRPAVAGG